MSAATAQLHPLFRPDSLYRLATNEWLWFDEGETAIRRFFEAHRRNELHAAWAHEIPTKTQDWGYGAEVDAGLHQHLLGQQERTRSQRDEGVLQGAAATPAATFHCPVLRFQMNTGATLLSSVPEQNPQLFGADDKVQPQSTKIQPQLTVNLRVDQPNRNCLLLLVSEPLLRRLEWLNHQSLANFPAVGAPPPAAWREGAQKSPAILNNEHQRVAKILTETFQHGLSEPADETEANLPQFRRAWWTSLVLGQAVGVSGVSRTLKDDPLAGPRLRKEIALHPQSPRLADLADPIWAVLCVGPEATSSET